MIPFRFGPPDRQLFGVFHPRSDVDGRRSAVLLCNPFGQEAVRVHRFFRVLAERLSRAGLDVLRFDPYGTGDSAGDDEDGDFEGWSQDVARAHDELVHRSRTTHVTWLGARLGGSLALRTSASVTGCTLALLLWDPILDGRSYLQHLRAKHIEALELSYGPTGPAWREQANANPSAFSNEAIGFGVSPALRAQLAALGPDMLHPPQGIGVDLLGDPADSVLKNWLDATAVRGSNVRFVPMVHEFDWTAEEALNTALVPSQVLRQCISLLTHP